MHFLPKKLKKKKKTLPSFVKQVVPCQYKSSQGSPFCPTRCFVYNLWHTLPPQWAPVPISASVSLENAPVCPHMQESTPSCLAGHTLVYSPHLKGRFQLPVHHRCPYTALVSLHLLRCRFRFESRRSLLLLFGACFASRAFSSTAHFLLIFLLSLHLFSVWSKIQCDVYKVQNM